MKKILLTVAAGLLSMASAQAAVIYGYQAWQPGKASPVRGPIYFDSAKPSQATLIADCSNMGVVYGGYYLDYHWIGQAIVQGTQSSVDGIYDINLATGERTLIAKGGSKMIDLTYDYANNRVLGIRTGNSWLASLNPQTGESSLIGRFTENGSDIYLLAIACALDGKLYGVGSNDVFYSIDATSGALTSIGNLGVDAGFDQTMAFDYNDGTLYWCNNGDYTLYTIDLTSGAATEVGIVGYDGEGSMGSLFVPYINVAKGAPDRVTDVKASSASSAITLSWANPAKTAQGDDLDALTGIIIERDGVEIATVTEGVTPGSQSSFTDAGLAEGKAYSYRIIPYNAAGRGGVDLYSTTAQTGKELPGAPANLKAAQGDGSAILSWEAPVAGIHGGEFEAADITGYDIYRNSTKVGSTQGLKYEDKAAFGTYTYRVVTMTANGAGGEASVENVLVKPESWIIMHTGSVEVASDKEYKFYDNGGPNANYSNSLNYTLTLVPAETNKYVCVDFTAFNLEKGYDWLTVYDGNSTDAPQIGKFSDNSVPADMRHIESSADNGALTFVFASDVMENLSGWEATVYTANRYPYDLAVKSLSAPAVITAQKEAKATVAVQNKGSLDANSYKVQLMADDVTVAEATGSLKAGEVAEHIMPYTLATAGEVTLSARVIYDADQDLANNTSELVKQTVLDAGTVMVDVDHQDAAQLYVVPASFMAYESICQSIIDSELLADGKNMQINALTFKLHTVTTDYANVPFRLWVSETTIADLENGIIPASQLTEVFHGTANIAQGDDELTFIFDKPLAYSGDNLVYTLHKEVSTASNSGVTFKGCYGYGCTHAKVTRFDSRWDANDEKVIDPDVTFGYSAQDHRADVKLIFSSNQGGVDNIVVDTEAVAYATANGIFATAGARVYNASGQIVAAPVTSGVVTLPKGIYLVKIGSKTQKVIVR